jgi:SAM-dependent methyltransferase
MQGADWDARYAAEPLLWGTGPNQFVRSRLAQAEPGAAVDLASGNGRNALWLARRGWRVTAVDVSAVALAQGMERARELGLQIDWQECDVRGWTPAEPVDLVLVAYLHLPVAELTAVLISAARNLTPGGRLLYVGHSRTNLTRGFGGPSDPAVLAEIADLAAAAADLHVRELAHLIRQTDQGAAIDILLDASPWPGHLSDGESSRDDPPLADVHPGVTKAGGR